MSQEGNNKRSTDIFQALWIGGPLSKMEQLSMKSFVDNGLEYHLYTYGEVPNVPEGVIIKDANEILDKSEIFRYKNGSVSAFSNLFRFTMLYKNGGYWVDTDLTCVKPFKFEEDYVIVSEPSSDYKKSIITSCFIKLPKESESARMGMVIQRTQKPKILSGEILWGSGPKTVQQIVQKCNLMKYVLPWKTICTCNCAGTTSLVNTNFPCNPSVIKDYDSIPEEMIGIHFWNEVWRRDHLDKNADFDKKSIYEKLKSKHSIQ